jgi:hypothetical protein
VDEPAATGMSPDKATARATLLVAAMRGLIMDHRAGADPARITGALQELSALIESWLGPAGSAERR